MDRISDSDSEDAGSIPAGATGKADIKRQADLKRAHWVSFEPACRFMSLYHPEAIDEGDLLQGCPENQISFRSVHPYYWGPNPLVMMP